MQVRQSELKAFANCPRQFFYASVAKLGEEEVGSLTTLGSVWHYAVDVYENFNHDIDLAIRTFLYYWENYHELGLKIDYWHRRTTYEGLKRRGVEMLQRYHEMAPWSGGTLIGTEIHFSVPIGEHTLNGTIDKLAFRPGRKVVEVTDFKTASHVPENLRENIQFTAYCYATLRQEFWSQIPGFEDGLARFDGWKRQGTWYHARNNKVFNAGYREEVDYQRLLLAVNEMAKAIEAKVFPLDISGETCGFCPFVNEVCGSEIPSPV